MLSVLQILDEWFGRTIIRSCTKLSYEHAQSMIERPAEKIPERELPPISPEHSPEELHQAVLNLHRIAKRLRRQRFANGALRLDQVGEHFTGGLTMPGASMGKMRYGTVLPCHCCVPTALQTPVLP